LPKENTTKTTNNQTNEQTNKKGKIYSEWEITIG
jgi:hypothetical protein